MLIDRKYKENDVISLKISSGEEVIGRFVKEDLEHIYITKPTILGMNQKGIAMMPFMITVDPDKEHALSKNAVITYQLTDQEIAKQYLSQTSGIALG